MLRIADNAPASASIRIHTPNRKTRIAPLPRNAVASPEGLRRHATGNVTEMFPFTRFDHVQLAMPPGGEADARHFYVAVLAFEELPKPPELAERGGAWFRCGDVQLHLGVENEFRAATKAHPALRCSNYAVMLERLRSKGIKIIQDPHRVNGAPHCYIADPFGNRIELIAENGQEA